MIEQTYVVHELISFSGEAEYSAPIDPLEYSWYALDPNVIGKNVPMEAVRLTYGNNVWFGIKQGQHHETRTDQTVNGRDVCTT